MAPNPFVGVGFHWLGGLAAASFYIPYQAVKRWSWETYWLVGGLFSWLVAPALLATLLVPGVWHLLATAPLRPLALAVLFGAMWGVGGLTFGLTMRYLGIALGVAVALGFCAAFGTLVPPIVGGEFGQILGARSGRVILLGVGVCLAGIGIGGLAGMSKERELSAEQKRATVKEFDFAKGMLVATLAGVLSACFAYGLAAGKPLADLAKASLLADGRSDLWQNLPVLVVVLLGGFATNFVWCVILNVRNRSGHEYLNLGTSNIAGVAAAEAIVPSDAASSSDRPADGRATATFAPAAEVVEGAAPAPLARNYLLSAAAGVTWYLQFFFYSMGETKMGAYGFSSWTLHMASIIIFSTIWGIALKEWQGTSAHTRGLLAFGLAVLIASTVVVGYGNYLKADGR